jgi:hypothetical protein
MAVRQSPVAINAILLISVLVFILLAILTLLWFFFSKRVIYTKANISNMANSESPSDQSPRQSKYTEFILDMPSTASLVQYPQPQPVHPKPLPRSFTVNTSASEYFLEMRHGLSVKYPVSVNSSPFSPRSDFTKPSEIPIQNQDNVDYSTLLMNRLSNDTVLMEKDL